MTCQNCNIELLAVYGSGRFCSLKCARSFSTKKKREQRIIFCDCGFQCNSVQQLQNHKIETHKTKFEDLKKDFTRKKWLLKERGRKCEICGITEWCGKETPITIDHIDGNPNNNLKENLRLICPNCHAQTETFCSKNSRNKYSKSDRAKLLAKYPRYRDINKAL